MQNINWFPEYWNFIEKTKLFDFWRSRYCKNNIYFSPNKENCGGVGFYDASYESLKFNEDKNKYSKIEEEYLKRKEFLLNEMSLSQEQDKKRLLLLIEVEEKAFEYWKIKATLKPIEDDIPDILKQTIWLIDEKERVFKESFSYLIEYDRKHLSPLTYPNRKLNEKPLTVSECFYWLNRENRVCGEKDKNYFNKNEDLLEIVNKFELLNIDFKPELLINRHEKSIKREERQKLKRTKNGDLLKSNDKNNEEVFERPVVLYSNELKEESIEIQIQKFKEQDIDKYNTDYKNDISIFVENNFNNVINDQNKITNNKKSEIGIFNKIFEKDNKRIAIPKNPYVLLQKNLFDLLESEEKNKEKEELLKELKNFKKERKKLLLEKQEEIMRKEKNEDNILSLLYFFKSNDKIKNKELQHNEKIKLDRKILERDGIIFLRGEEVEEEQNKTELINNPEKFKVLDVIDEKLETFEDLEDQEEKSGSSGSTSINLFGIFGDIPEDDFDDKTRFNFFIRDKNGLHFNRKALIGKFIKNRNNLLNKFKNTSNSLKNKAILMDIKNKLSAIPNKLKLGLENNLDLLLNKVANAEFKENLEEIKNYKEEKDFKIKVENELKSTTKGLEYPKYKPN